MKTIKEIRAVVEYTDDSGGFEEEAHLNTLREAIDELEQLRAGHTVQRQACEDENMRLRAELAEFEITTTRPRDWMAEIARLKEVIRVKDAALRETITEFEGLGELFHTKQFKNNASRMQRHYVLERARAALSDTPAETPAVAESTGQPLAFRVTGGEVAFATQADVQLFRERIESGQFRLEGTSLDSWETYFNGKTWERLPLGHNAIPHSGITESTGQSEYEQMVANTASPEVIAERQKEAESWLKARESTGQLKIDTEKAKARREELEAHPSGTDRIFAVHPERLLSFPDYDKRLEENLLTYARYTYRDLVNVLTAWEAEAHGEEARAIKAETKLEEQGKALYHDQAQALISERDALKNSLRHMDECLASIVSSRDAYKHDLDVRTKELDAQYSENAELKAMLGKGPFVPLSQHENVRKQRDQAFDCNDNLQRRYNEIYQDLARYKGSHTMIEQRDHWIEQCRKVTKELNITQAQRDEWKARSEAWEKGVAVDERLIRVWKRRHQRMLKVAIRYRRFRESMRVLLTKTYNFEKEDK